ncbi:hypothetical protein D9757_002363 [Collybiopsis confluens]|uniref:Sodium/calcium exchanger membrane region domain-containing protein n=1 Tax=Collybiopsis confluens TaxID=2823264 RepID=A0A8H5HY35_9AGAR|nr:hypothetical protein D9757_002363 [Collybiopsis confluens]
MAYHFTLSGGKDDIPDYQRNNILAMSHAVSLILLTIYGFYLVFQLVSHTHLYQDSLKKSQKLNIPAPNIQTPAIFHTLTFRDRGKNGSVSQASHRTGYREDAVSQWFKGVHTEDSARSRSISPSLSYGSSVQLQPGTPYMSQPPGLSSTSELTSAARMQPSTACDSTIRLVDLDVDGGGVYSVTRLPSRCGSEGSNTTLGGEGRSFSGSTINSDHHAGLTLETGDSNLEKFTGLLESELSSPIGSEPSSQEPHLSWFMTIFALLFVTIAVAFIADWLVEAMNGVSTTIRKEWIALILLPAVTSIVECGNAIGVSVKDQVTLSISVAVGSSIQTALFVIPLMVTISWAMGKPLALLFDPFQSLVLYISGMFTTSPPHQDDPVIEYSSNYDPCCRGWQVELVGRSHPYL